MGINVLLEGNLGTMSLFKEYFIHNYNYKLLTFHTPAEHTIAGKRLDMEMQIVFETADTHPTYLKGDQEDSATRMIPQYVIISVLFAESHQESEFLNQLRISNMPTQPGFKKSIEYLDKIDLNLIFSKQNQFKHERF